MSVRDEKSEQYLGDRKLVVREGYVVIFSEERTQPACCPVCDTVLRTKADEEELRKLMCCYQCARTWAYPRITEWKNGWRPTKEEIAQQPQTFTEFSFKLD